MKTLGNVNDSHSANCFKSVLYRGRDSRTSKRFAAEKDAALHGVAGFAGGGRCFPRALHNRAIAQERTEIAAIPQWIHFEAENRAHGERLGGNALLSHGRGAGHLDTPILELAILALDQLAVRPDTVEMWLRMIGLRHELEGHPGEYQGLSLIVHREGMMGQCRPRRDTQQSEGGDARAQPSSGQEASG